MLYLSGKHSDELAQIVPLVSSGLCDVALFFLWKGVHTVSSCKFSFASGSCSLDVLTAVKSGLAALPVLSLVQVGVSVHIPPRCQSSPTPDCGGTRVCRQVDLPSELCTELVFHRY